MIGVLEPVRQIVIIIIFLELILYHSNSNIFKLFLLKCLIKLYENYMTIYNMA